MMNIDKLIDYMAMYASVCIYKINERCQVCDTMRQKACLKLHLTSQLSSPNIHNAV